MLQDDCPLARPHSTALPRPPVSDNAPDKWEPLQAYWSASDNEVLGGLQTTASGLHSDEAEARLHTYGLNILHASQPVSRLSVLWDQLRSPLLGLLVFAAVISALSAQWSDALIVTAIVALSTGIGFQREYSAQRAALALQSRLKTRAAVWRDGRVVELEVEQVVPGDVIRLAAGSLVPADALVLEAQDCHVTESVLTGESFPVQKRPGVFPADTPLARRQNCVFLGTNVRSGTATCVVVKTGAATQFGGIAQRLTLRPPETEFDRGIRHFGYLLSSAMFVMVMAVFAVQVLQGKPTVQTLLFSVALAVGLSPELLPAILSISLARAAQTMAEQGVLVRRLNAIENLGSMDVLCTDKTGTLTEGVVQLEGAFDVQGQQSDAVLTLGVINAALETGLPSPMDEAIVQARGSAAAALPNKLAEIPFDFVRKRVSVIVAREQSAQLIMKGAFNHVLEVCEQLSGGLPLGEPERAELQRRYREWSSTGMRVLAVAQRALPLSDSYGREQEHALSFEGFLVLMDRPKAGAAAAIAALAERGVAVKLISGDNQLVAKHVAGLVGFPSTRLLTGAELDILNDEALWNAAERVDIFAEVDPNQKERIILALKKTGHVVGFLGDGVNDAPAMHAADASLSVQQAADVAREAADFVLVEADLDVIRRGIDDGRKTFANTLKYILTTTSANLGNMVSMAVASLFLPFLPLTAGQILLNNFLSDVPAMGIVDDRVDPELVARPERWRMRFIGRFMVEFGLLSSLFDMITFGALLLWLRVPEDAFRTGWFISSLLTELLVALVVRTRGPFYKSRPGRVLLWSTLLLIPITYAIPLLPGASALGFVPLSVTVQLVVTFITIVYVLAAELTKYRFYRAAER